MNIIYPMRDEIKFDEYDTHEFSIIWNDQYLFHVIIKSILFSKIYMIYSKWERERNKFFYIKVIIKNVIENKIIK